MELKTITRGHQHATRGHDRPGAAASIAIITNATLNTIRGIIIVKPPVRFAFFHSRIITLQRCGGCYREGRGDKGHDVTVSEASHYWRENRRSLAASGGKV